MGSLTESYAYQAYVYANAGNTTGNTAYFSTAATDAYWAYRYAPSSSRAEVYALLAYYSDYYAARGY